MADQNLKKTTIKLFSDFINIQSVSADSIRNLEILKAVEFLKKELNSLGFQVNIYKENNCPPLIIAEKIISSDVKTIGIYAHYDVQPEDPIEQWDSPPFKLVLKNGKFYGRGVADDKGHIIQVIAAIKGLTRLRQDSGGQSNNIVLIFEGEEETGSTHFEKLITNTKEELNKIDVFYMLDFGMEGKNTPEIFWGLRGLIAFELQVIVGDFDLHSGVYGNEINNPIQILSELFSKIKDSRTRKILIPGFYDKVKFVNKNNLWLSTKIHPSFDINGIVGGYTGEGTKTIIPGSATAKFSFRLIENQTTDEIEILVNQFIKKNLPKGIKFSLKTSGKLEPFYTDKNNQYLKITKKILKEVFGKNAALSRSGGSIGAASILSRVFQKPIILTGFTLSDCNLHSPNENYDEEMFYKGIEAVEKFLSI
jgi:acetylornithine deacetylase/succinyl-diaminopimelate desuccinylase-like protein